MDCVDTRNQYKKSSSKKSKARDGWNILNTKRRGGSSIFFLCYILSKLNGGQSIHHMIKNQQLSSSSSLISTAVGPYESNQNINYTMAVTTTTTAPAILPQSNSSAGPYFWGKW
ncbi:hypothetical protein DFA_09168 [Cavenderia fasciculata]|uniref:Uncharacterized protein n=1 Tax=Cavenderia fasciculata TaxID=261658 RepID=F4Q6W1_CACFS|nr:uncharacterized protein DFA_09168 [Cavenderia fasciculata]EGG16143.1 hypothetical protein DFA_09168 [Cavenderia fasciculata]|eukprot:XP_004352596.1 hypothetical protein DFA_09168 [Cavenderia fasciculata]